LSGEHVSPARRILICIANASLTSSSTALWTDVLTALTKSDRAASTTRTERSHLL